MARLLAPLFLLASGIAWAQEPRGTLVPTDGGPGLDIASQEVDVRIANGVAVTRVTQVFRNNEPRQREAIYSFPVPGEAGLSNFSMWIDGKEIIGEVLERQKARQIYDSIVSKQKDPGLLEQVSYKRFEARVFPVPANGTQKVQIAWYQPCDYDGGVVTYTYPLESKTAAPGAGTFKLDVRVVSEIPIAKIGSPSHKELMAVRETSPGLWRASFEQPRGRLDRDFVVVYQLERERYGLALVPYAAKGQEGYFMLMLTAGEELDRADVPINLTILLDVSGSMSDERKLATAVIAAERVLKALGERDTFSLITFNIGADAASREPVAATADNVAAALHHLRKMRAAGGTELAPALEMAAKRISADRANVVLVLSDGNTTESEDHAAFRTLLAGNKGIRIFTLGVGNEVNRPLLSTLADRTGGYAGFLSPDDDIPQKVDLLRQKLLHQVAEELELKVDGVRVSELTPAKLPNLFRGSQAVLYGRYHGSGKATITVTGRIGGKERTITLEADFPADDRDMPEVRRMWAWKRADELMRRVRLEGADTALVAQITQIGIEYSIVTPYTSFLVLENDAQYRQLGIDQKNKAQVAEDRTAQERRWAPPDSSTAQDGRTGGRFGGGSVEIGLLALLGVLAAGRVARKRT